MICGLGSRPGSSSSRIRDADQSGADTIDTLVEWHESVGGIHRASPEDDEDHDIDDPYQVEVDQNV